MPAARDIAAYLIVLGLGAALIKFGGKRILGPLTAMAVIVLLANGAEASIGLEGDDALEALFKLSDAKGQQIPDDVKDALRKDPELRQLLTDAAKSGNYSQAEQKAGEAMTRSILNNRDAFTQEELEILLKATEGNKGSLPQGEVTVEELKKQIELKKKAAAGQPAEKPGRGGEAPGADRPMSPGAGAAPSVAPKAPEERLVDGMASSLGGGPKLTPALKARLIEAARSASPALTDAEVDELLARLGPAAGKSEDEIVESVRHGITTLRTSKKGEAGPDAPEQGATGNEKSPPSGPGTVPVDQAVKKAKQGKEDPETKKVLEETFGFVKSGNVIILGPKDLVFVEGRAFSGSVVGRDKDGRLFFGKANVTPHRAGGSWRLDVPAGFKLTGAAGYYGATQEFTAPAVPGAGVARPAAAPAGKPAEANP